MTKSQRTALFIALIAILSNIFWIECLTYNQLTAHNHWNIHIEPLAKDYLPGIVYAWATLFIGLIIYPFVFWMLPILVYINLLHPYLRRYLLS
jgi:hypothetical protein